MDPHERAALLEQWAVEIGFDRSGVARLGPSATGDFFVDWLAAGRHAGMEYLSRRIEVRLDPSVVFPGASSAVCVALQYGRDVAAPVSENDLWQGVARYAVGADYHDLMGKMLDELADRIENAFPGTKTRRYVDTGPILERDLAAAAGLGAVGKNTCLLHPEAGSWFFLGELLTSLELAPAAPMADLCGSCARCLEACPTGALTEPYELDANLCISYWTIEHRGSLPEEVRPLLGHWVFGCDVCQEVCPSNESVPTGLHPALEPRRQAMSLTLAGLLALDVTEYRRTFRGSAMKRAKLVGLKRNAIVAMGNSGSSGYVEPLTRVLDEKDENLRLHAAWALGRIGGDAARRELAASLRGERSAAVRREIQAALEQLECPS